MRKLLIFEEEEIKSKNHRHVSSLVYFIRPWNPTLYLFFLFLRQSLVYVCCVYRCCVFCVYLYQILTTNLFNLFHCNISHFFEFNFFKWRQKTFVSMLPPVLVRICFSFSLQGEINFIFCITFFFTPCRWSILFCVRRLFFFFLSVSYLNDDTFQMKDLSQKVNTIYLLDMYLSLSSPYSVPYYFLFLHFSITYYFILFFTFKTLSLLIIIKPY